MQIEFIKDTPTVKKTKPLEPYVDTAFFYKGDEITRKRKFRKYCQDINGKTVYFKEFGDPRVMDKRNGEYVGEGGAVDLDNQANEIMEFAIGTMPYGEVRWIGQILGVDGSRRAEYLNNNYFKNGRHTPLMILIKGGTLTDDSFTKLTEYMNGIKGEAGQHAFIVLEAESVDNRAGFDDEQKPEIEVNGSLPLFCKKTNYSKTTSTTTAAGCSPLFSCPICMSDIQPISTERPRKQQWKSRKSKYFSRSGKALRGLSTTVCSTATISSMLKHTSKSRTSTTRTICIKSSPSATTRAD